MIFASVNAGHYLIIQSDHVIAEIKRKYVLKRGAHWPVAVYVLSWNRLYTEYDGEKVDDEEFLRVSDIHKKYPFENYKGFGHILSPQRQYCDS